MATPRVEINLKKLGQNISVLQEFYAAKNINLMMVTKVIGGNPLILKALKKNGIKIIADSRIQNIKKMRLSGIKSIFVLLRGPSLSQAKDVVKYADISHNTEYNVIQKLSEIAIRRKSRHKIILMIELGDLREGIMPKDIVEITEKVLKLKGIKLVGIGTNLACFGGIEPDVQKMEELTSIVYEIEQKFNVNLKYVSGGSSANYNWSLKNEQMNRINYLRLGEAVFLGREPLNREAIPGLNTDVFTLFAEVIESKIKPSLPYGKKSQDAYGESTPFKDEGPMHRIILAIGKQDVQVSGLTPRNEVEILGASSDHLIINTKKLKIEVGQELPFDMNYSALLTAMQSRDVKKFILPK